MPFYHRTTYDDTEKPIEVNQAAKTLGEALDQELKFFVGRSWKDLKMVKVEIKPQD